MKNIILLITLSILAIFTNAQENKKFGKLNVVFEPTGQVMNEFDTVYHTKFIIDLTEIEVEPEQPSSLENFAKCLTEKGMKFYGAEWCSWCKKENELFAEAVQYLPYIECVDEGSDELTAECQEAGISGFPTWQLPNGELVSGFKTLEELSELSGCSI